VRDGTKINDVRRSHLPTGTVTFLFTDVEGSTKLLHTLGAQAYADALAEHRRVVRAALTRNGGVEVDTQGDSFFVAFPTAPGALAAASDATQALADGPIRVRVGIHTGTPLLGEEGYVGEDVHKGARIAAAGHGGQILVSAATAALVDAAHLHDLGSHRLKDLGAPERIYQLGDETHPPLKTLHQTNLPVPVTAFLGREAELAELSVLLRRDDLRLVTLTGPGGTGKTRLALQAVADAADGFPDGVWWVPLAALRDPALVLSSASTALGASGEPADHIGDKQLLLLFDNFEHLTAAAGDVAELIARCPNLKVVLTSREALHLGGEQEYAVDPLRRDDAVELFLTRALAVKHDFAADGEVAAICERLDHLPLAIELAAARAKILPPAALLERLERRLPLLAGGQRDAPERQRTLRATIEWSHELLTEDEQRLFARLAVFRSGWTLDAAEKVADADLDTLQSLVDKSLIRVRDTGRFGMLETIREFAAEQLEASGDADDVHRRHADHFLALAEEAEAHLHGGPTEKEWLDRLERDHDNLRAALDWLHRSGPTDAEQRLAAALIGFWVIRAHIGEGERRLEAALRTAEGPTDVRARLHHGYGMILSERGGRSAEARAHIEEALAIYDGLGLPNTDASLAMHTLGLLVAEEGDYLRARDLFDASVRISRELGDEHYAMVATDSLAWTSNELGDRERARALYEDNLRRARATSNRRLEGWSLDSLAMVEVDEGRATAALDMLRQALQIYRELGLEYDTATSFNWFAAALAATGRPQAATALLARAMLAYEELGVSEVDFWIVQRNEKSLASIHAQLDDAAFADAWWRGRELTVDQAVQLALDETSDQTDAA
jgi:predicted ATPase/class 3 adenylate cyclase